MIDQHLVSPDAKAYNIANVKLKIGKLTYFWELLAFLLSLRLPRKESRRFTFGQSFQLRFHGSQI